MFLPSKYRTNQSPKPKCLTILETVLLLMYLICPMIMTVRSGGKLSSKIRYKTARVDTIARVISQNQRITKIFSLTMFRGSTHSRSLNCIEPEGPQFLNQHLVSLGKYISMGLTEEKSKLPAGRRGRWVKVATAAPQLRNAPPRNMSNKNIWPTCKKL